VTGNLALVGHLAREVAARLPRHLDTDDLAGAGALALVQAARTYDPDHGVPFARFAATRVRGAMLDHMRSRDWATRSLRSRARALAAVAEELTGALHRAPTDAELATAAGMTESEVREVRDGTNRAALLSLDPVGVGENGLAANLTDTGPRPEEALIAAERLGYLRDALAELPERQRLVVTEYYLEQHQLTEIAERLGVTQSRASQLRAEGLDLLRDALTTLLHTDARAGEGASAGSAADSGASGGAAAKAADGLRARRRSAYIEAVARRSPVRERADVQAYLDGAALGSPGRGNGAGHPSGPARTPQEA